MQPHLSPKRILLVDDHTIVRAALKNQCKESYPGSTVDESSDGKNVLDLVSAHDYDLIIMDIQIPNCDTLELINRIATDHPSVPVLVYSMTSPLIYGLRVMKAGAKGFVSKISSIEELETAIGLAIQGHKYVCQEIADHVSENYGFFSDTPFSALSPREIQIASLLLSGQTVTEISKLLNIGMSTVGTHKANIFLKLRINNLLELKELSNLYKFE
jgi:two-component system, NarL family, invasion response regulator UvrY